MQVPGVSCAVTTGDFQIISHNSCSKNIISRNAELTGSDPRVYQIIRSRYCRFFFHPTIVMSFAHQFQAEMHLLVFKQLLTNNCP